MVPEKQGAYFFKADGRHTFVRHLDTQDSTTPELTPQQRADVATGLRMCEKKRCSLLNVWCE
jgi:hypothetical protein